MRRRVSSRRTLLSISLFAFTFISCTRRDGISCFVLRGNSWQVETKHSWSIFFTGDCALITCHGFPSYGHCYCPVQSPPAPVVSKTVIWCVSIALGLHSSSYLCTPRLSLSLILDPLALPLSPGRPSPTQAPSAARMLSLAKLTMHRHVHIAFPFVHLVHITSRFLIAHFPMTL